VRELHGQPRGDGRRVAVVASRFHAHVTERLVDGAVDGLRHHGVDDDAITVVWVPGAFEIPVAARALAEAGGTDAIVCLGAVVRGETAHFDLVARAAAEGIARVASSTGVPCAFEVLATETLEHAEARAGGEHGNKGWEAARTALETASVLREIRGERDG
jgi:6,7-dimethyl-8-ribityllumazine synthase